VTRKILEFVYGTNTNIMSISRTGLQELDLDPVTPTAASREFLPRGLLRQTQFP
jgi:hypothetical protein